MTVTYLHLREVAVDEGTLLKKFRKSRENFSPFSILSAGWQVLRARICISFEKSEIEILISLSYGNYP